MSKSFGTLAALFMALSSIDHLVPSPSYLPPSTSVPVVLEEQPNLAMEEDSSMNVDVVEEEEE